MVATATILSCLPIDKPNTLNPKILFAGGSAFLSDASTLAIKGRIEFTESHAEQSGSFQLFLNGPDSASFLIEGPLGADAFRLVVLGDIAQILADDGWIAIAADERVDISEYGIENISPFLVGPLIFPQYYPVDLVDTNDVGYLAVTVRGHGFSSRLQQFGEYFNLIDPRTGIIAEYRNRKEFDEGFYPSSIETFNPQSSGWKINLKITRIRENPTIPPTVWQTD
jgi:hypothetical protein